jgi:hypothetical protein
MKTSVRWGGLYLLHLVIATLGVGLATATLLETILKPLLAPDVHARLISVASGTYYAPEVLLAGAAGYFGYGLLRGNHRFWVWILPTVYLAIKIILWTPTTVLADHNWHATLAHFFVGTPQHYPEGNITIPFYTSLSYTFGALLDAGDVFRFQRPTPSAGGENTGVCVD